MVAFMSVSLVRRVQEFGIRRVHGATSINLIQLLIKEFLWQFIVAGVLAFALAYFFLTTWLSNFQYRIDIPLATFLLCPSRNFTGDGPVNNRVFSANY